MGKHAKVGIANLNPGNNIGLEVEGRRRHINWANIDYKFTSDLADHTQERILRRISLDPLPRRFAIFVVIGRDSAQFLPWRNSMSHIMLRRIAMQHRCLFLQARHGVLDRILA